MLEQIMKDGNEANYSISGVEAVDFDAAKKSALLEAAMLNVTPVDIEDTSHCLSYWVRNKLPAPSLFCRMQNAPLTMLGNMRWQL
jgi:hypothetical protein